MFEIPIFRFFENRKVNQEMDIRTKNGVNPRSVPIPMVNPMLNKPINLNRNILPAQKFIKPNTNPNVNNFPQNIPKNPALDEQKPKK